VKYISGRCAVERDLQNGLLHVRNSNPLVTIATFSRPILPNLAGNVEYGKNRIPLFCLYFKVKIMKIFVYEYFHIFLMVHVYSTAYDDKTLTVHRK
jgi:hypothetical protein